VTDDSKDDAIAAGRVGKAGHGPRSSPHFPETKLRSITLVVRTFFQCPADTSKNCGSASRSRSTQATARGRRASQRCFHSRKARHA